MEWLIYVVTGLVTGFLAGLFGIGGGLIIVPILVYVLTLQQINIDLAMHMAIATSLATIFFTSVSAVIVQMSYSSINWRVFIWMSLGICFGSLVGAVFTSHLPGRVLRLIIGYFSLTVAIQLLLTNSPASLKFNQKSREKTTALNLVIGGLIIGYLSAMFGIGGGLLITPYLNWRRIPIRSAVATASACTLPVSLIGTLGYLMVSKQLPSLPSGSLGYIYLPALIPIVIFSMLFARLGVKSAHHLPEIKLKQAFACLLIAVSLLFIFQQ